MHRHLIASCALTLGALLLTSTLSAQPPAATSTAASDRTIAVTYKGPGAVDATNDILVFAFDHADVTANSRPLGLKYIQKNGGTATFSGLADPVYIHVAYDAKGNYDGTSGPPEPGTPIGAYAGRNGQPLPVKAGEKVKLTFTDAVQWK